MKIKVENYFLRDPVIQTNGSQNMGFIIVALNEFKYLRASTRVAYNIIKSFREVERAIKDLEETRIAVCQSLCQKDEEGNLIQINNQFQFSEDGKIEFATKYQELLQQVVELDIFPIQNSDINDLPNVSVAAYETLLKFGFIQEEEKKAKDEKEKIL